MRVALPVWALELPAGRPVCKAAVYLASDDASFINGVELFVDGGMAQI